MEKGVIDVSLKMRREPWFKGEGFLCTFSVTLVIWFVSLLVCLGGEMEGGGKTYEPCASGITTRKSPETRLERLGRRTARPN